MSPWIIAVLTPLLLFAAGVGAKEQVKPPESAERMVFGAVYRGSVYTAETTQAFAKGDFAEGGVTASSIELNREMPWIDFPARWKIGDGSLIVIFDEYKQFGLIGIRQRNFSQGTCDLRKLSERAKKEDHARYELVYNFIFGPWGGPRPYGNRDGLRAHAQLRQLPG